MQKLKSYLIDKSQKSGHRWYVQSFTKNSHECAFSDESPFYIASCAKSIVGLLCLKLIKSDANFHKHFSTYLNGFNLNDDNLCIFDFLSHKTDLKDYLADHDENHGLTTKDVLQQYFANKRITTSQSFNYSNTNYIVVFDFLDNTYGFKNLLDKLNQETSDQFVMFVDQQIVSYSGNEKKILEGKKNQVHGDGGLLLMPSLAIQNKPTVMQKLVRELEENKDLFNSNASTVDSDTIYSFGVFKNASTYFHSGFYNSNISLWVANKNGHGHFLCVNHENINKSEIDALLLP